VIQSICQTLVEMPGLEAAKAGEFTRRFAAEINFYIINILIKEHFIMEKWTLPKLRLWAIYSNQKQMPNYVFVMRKQKLENIYGQPWKN
jgi:hypothetical protein